MEKHQTLLSLLTKDVDYEVRDLVSRRVSYFHSNFMYLLHEKKDEHILFLIKQGWDLQMINIVSVLSAFYQIVLGPLVSSTHSDSKVGLGYKVPISYGTLLKFNTERNVQIQEAHEAFTRILESKEISFWWIQAASANDLVYRMQKDIKEKEFGLYE
ncbi:MAG: hypothetical protein NUK65_05815 [Firmicutes bacterium]|nr:hypothetical protein [Bacillota bacterium]